MSWLDPNWQYVPARETDILARFRALGWTPPSELARLRRVNRSLELAIAALPPLKRERSSQ